MRLSISKSKNATSYYVIKSIYENGKKSTRVVEKLGTAEELEKKLNGQDIVEWANSYIDELNKKEKAMTRDIMIKYSPTKLIPKEEQRFFNGGYLFLQKIYHELKLDEICESISKKYKFSYNLNSILSRLIYARVIFPASKLETLKLSKRFIEQPDFKLQHIYRSLEVISKETDFIQSTLYKNSREISKRRTGILYYDCTNYYFEIEEAQGLKQFCYSKDHKPNPAVQMGLFMDADGIPLAFNINCGNTNEQITMKPLEQLILSDFDLSKFVVCTDAGLASTDNRLFNDEKGRAFVTVQSVKKLKSHIKKWVLDQEGWHLPGELEVFNISALNENDAGMKEKVFYKERWINEDGLEQRIIVTYSIKYRDYLRSVRNSQIERAKKAIETKNVKVSRNQNDYKRLISQQSVTPDGEVADKEIYEIDTKKIKEEEMYDGYYAVCTDLEDDVETIVKINKRRWEIEECFRIMKSEFKARPVYLSRDDRISAHFMICFIALSIYRLLEKKLQEKFTCHEIIDGLRSMNFSMVKGEGYIPTYTRNDFTDALHDAYQFRTDYQIVTSAQMKKIISNTKGAK